MSLLKQLFLAICLLIVIAFTGSFISGVESSREQALNQLRSHAQDSATALGLSMSPHVDDPAMIELMVSSIFDSGYFDTIRVVSIADESVIVERKSDGISKQTNVPAWFVSIVALQPEWGDALLMRGWEQVARVEVLSDPQFLIAKLWDSAIASLLWLLLCGVLSALLGGWLLRTQLRPLDKMVDQAEAISRREFLPAQHIPRTPELRRVVQAMNLMVEKLRTLFAEEAARSEKLRIEAYQDNLTGLANRRLLDIRLSEQLAISENNASGYLLFMHLADLAALNLKLGGQKTDALIKSMGEVIKQQLQKPDRSRWLGSRSRAGEFTMVAPGLNGQDADQLASALIDAVQQLPEAKESGMTPIAYIGIGAFTPGESPAVVFGRTDQALAEAQGTPGKTWARKDDSSAQIGNSVQDWRDWIDDALRQGKLKLLFQPVVACADTSKIMHRKVLARLVDPQGAAIAAGQFLPWIERLGWSARLDMAMLEKAIKHLRKHPQPLALSLSGQTLRDAESQASLLQILRNNPRRDGLLTLELDERHLPPAVQLEQLSQAVRAAGYNLGLQHFGGNFGLIDNLTNLGLAYLKIDGSYIRAIDQEADKRTFIEAIYRATNSIDMPLIAEMVETEGELAVLAQIGIEGAMGRLIGPPAPRSE
ncbi:bifunctional diguanylate cyclase/phosphodiesterase [Pseudomonas sp. N040]|uniref:bifunctional diguanylate cyclase/phosphodiesterase n=1 Tax=Pseudomonas sp. N040 TaxID=2785325 RepID=UPI0018A2F8BF|nr:EAL domain-containing protein [Pseudomonas sp. N040]MBF7730856.1 EAL domain-containing protein [Pseudomonas sp. N040]MBW7014499.1 EAL domain-containing protein [Pseudomonas sp. N040]